jgi:hypothetical protein
VKSWELKLKVKLGSDLRRSCSSDVIVVREL